MYSRAIHLDNVVLAYDVHGRGSRALLLFHGVGQDRSIFHQLPSRITDTYRIYAFDLFYHGESKWDSTSPISKQDWHNLLIEFCSVEQVEKISVLGYSIGARFALATLEALPKLVTTCFLIAPDGLVQSPWFRLATCTAMGRYIFKSLMDNPDRLNMLLRAAKRLGIMDIATGRFIEHQLDTERKRLRIYQIWTAVRSLSFDRTALAGVVESEHIQLVVYLATRDRMVPIAPVRTFLKRLKSAHLEIIESNHRRVFTEALERIAAK